MEGRDRSSPGTGALLKDPPYGWHQPHPAVYQAQDIALEPDIDSVFNRLGVINDVRNQLVHYGVTRPWGETDNLPYVSNERTAARADKVQEVIVAVSDLELMD